MKRKIFKKTENEKGFTLIEVIVSLIVAAILGTILAVFMGARVTASANPVILARNGNYLNSIMENMGSDYKYQMSTAAKSSLTPATGLGNFITNVGAEGSTKSNYSPDTANQYTVVENHRISFSATSPYTEVADSSGKILKVTIRYNNLSATTLFTE